MIKTINEQIAEILSAVKTNVRYLKVMYVTNDNKIKEVNADLLSAKASFLYESWETINMESLKAFAQDTDNFKCFFHSGFEKILTKNLTTELLIEQKNNLCSLGTDIYLLNINKA
ncbi:hypothetical protein LMH73_028065 [Vibrio splendidus]|nr:hypothetical protein [Vibrio splendidus]MCC4882479.1 hypothetical protein [Vibrio splendidus]